MVDLLQYLAALEKNYTLYVMKETLHDLDILMKYSHSTPSRIFQLAFMLCKSFFKTFISVNKYFLLESDIYPEELITSQNINYTLTFLDKIKKYIKVETLP